MNWIWNSFCQAMNLYKSFCQAMPDLQADYISELERGKKVPSIKRLDYIANALDIEIHKFFMENP